jgi:hypothetical protein
LLLPLNNLEYPILETVVITYDPTVTAQEQADKDLQGLARNLSKKLKSAKKMHAEFEMAREREQEERASLELAAAEEAKRKQEARERRKMRLQDDLSTQTKKQTETEKVPEGNRGHHKTTKHVDKSKRHADRKATKSKPVEMESAAKPRELLTSFTQADIPPFEGISATQEKKVHWNDNGKRVSDGLTTDVYVDETGSSPVLKKARRKTFGGTSTRVSTKSEKDEKSKRRSKSSSDDRRKTDEGLSSRGRNTSKKPSDSIKDFDMDVVEKDPKERTTTKQPSHSATALVATSKKASESTTFPDIFSSELNPKDDLKERKSSKHRSRSTSDLVATSSVSGRSKQRESTTSTGPSKERKASKHRSHSTSDWVATTSVSGRSSDQRESSTSMDPSKERKSFKDRSHSTSDLAVASSSGLTSKPSESTNSMDPPKERKTKKQRSRSTTDLVGMSKDPSEDPKSAKHRSHSTTDLVEMSTSGHSSKPLKSSLATKPRSSKVKKSDYIDILNAKPKSSKKVLRPLDSNSAFEKKSSQPTKVRSSTDKAKRSDRSKQELASGKVSSSVSSKRRSSDEMTAQSTGIPSTERAPKGRRRKKTQTAGATKSKVQSFGEDCTFDFHKL